MIQEYGTTLPTSNLFDTLSALTHYASVCFFLSTISSNFTFSSSTTDGSSAPSSLFDHKPHEESKTGACFAQLKKCRIVIKSGPSIGTEEAEMARWKKAADDHKKYVIFLHYAYTFHTALLERETFSDYSSGWLEALGDLAHYHIVIAAMVPASMRHSQTLTAAAVRSGLGASPDRSSMSLTRTMSTGSSEKHPAHPDSPGPSMGIVAARLMELEPEKDRRWSGTLRVSRELLGMANCTTIWDSLSARQRARSCVASTTLLRGDVSIYITPGPVTNQPSTV